MTHEDNVEADTVKFGFAVKAYPGSTPESADRVANGLDCSVTRKYRTKTKTDYGYLYIWEIPKVAILKNTL